MKPPRVTIITPSYNQGQFIRRTIDSVLEQGYPDIEYMVLDGGSTDGTVDILRSYGKALEWISEPDDGQADAINKGMARASGDVVAFLNSDDYYLPGAVQSAVDALLHTGRLWVSAPCVIIDENEQVIHRQVTLYKNFLHRFSSPLLLSLVNYINQPSTFWMRDAMQQVGCFDASLDFVFDYDYWLRLMKICPPAILRKPLSAFRVHSQSKGGAKYRQQFDEELQVLARHTRNPLIRGLHTLHNRLIVTQYMFIKR